jgi:hypothetical protein
LEGAVAEIFSGARGVRRFFLCQNFAHNFFRFTLESQMDEEREECALRPAHAHKNIGRRSEVSI